MANWSFGNNTSNNNNNSNTWSNSFGNNNSSTNWGSSNNNNNSSSSFNFNNNNNNNNNNSNFNWNSTGNTNTNNNNNNNSNNRQSQFVTRQTAFTSLPNDKKMLFVNFEKQVVEATTKKKKELDETIKKLEQLPDITHSLQMYNDQTTLLTEKINSYKHDLEPFTNKLKKEFVYASQVQVDVQRQSSIQSQQLQRLPPPFYWDKIEQFQQKILDLRKQLENLQQHLNDAMNNQQTEVVNTKSVTNALNASHRSTLNIAAQVIANHNAIQEVKKEYKKFRLRYFGDSHDPFMDRTPKKGASVNKIEQYVNKGLELNGLQEINLYANNQSQNQNNNNNNFGGNTTNFNFGANKNNNTNNNNNNNNNSNNSGGGLWGNNTSNNNTNNSNSGNNNNSTSFNWGGSGNNNNTTNNSNNNNSGGGLWGNTGNNNNTNSFSFNTGSFIGSS